MKKLYMLIIIMGVYSNCNLFSQSWTQYNKLVASDRQNDDWFGYASAISGDYAIISAPIEDHDLVGGNFLSGAGSAYVYHNTGGSWAQTQKLVAGDRGTNNNFGFSISISGSYAAISANSDSKDSAGLNPLTLAGSVYIFKNNAGTWSQYQKIVASDREQAEQFGTSLSMDGNYLFVGVPAEDEGGPGDDVLSFAGAVYVFQNIAGAWTEIQKIVPSVRAFNDQFGRSVSVSGDYAIIGASFEDEDASGGSTVGDAGSAYIYKNIAGTWTEFQKIVASDRGAGDQFGFTSSMSGDYAIVGARCEDQDAIGGNTLSDAGSAYIFHNNGSSWSQVQKIVTSDRQAGDSLSYSISLDGNFAVITATGQDFDNSGLNNLASAGAAYIFKNNSGTWSEIQKITSADRGASDYFGFSASVSGNYVVVAAYHEDQDTSGLNTKSDAGSAYIFHDPLALPVELTSFSASLVDNKVTLNWQTATETNNYGFEVEKLHNYKIERLKDFGNANWEKVGFIIGNGNSSSVKNYSFTDENISQDKSYYRLKQIDSDGKFEYSKIVEASFMKPNKFTLEQNYPNPFNPSTTISYSVPKYEIVKLTVYNLLGQLVSTLVDEYKEAGTYSIQFSATGGNSEGLSSGIYFYKLESGGVVISKKMSLLK